MLIVLSQKWLRFNMNFYSHISFLILLLFVSCGIIVSQDAATLNCLEVESDTSVILYWSPPKDITGFVKYVINYSFDNNKYSEIGSIFDVSKRDFTHTNAQTDRPSNKYFITSFFNNDTVNSDTLQTIFLQVDYNDPADAKLYWNTVSDPLPDGSSVYYEIHKEYPTNTWSVIDSVLGITYNDPIIVCFDTITYQIVIRSDNNCKSVSNRRGGWFNDEKWPAIPVFDSVSVNSDNNPILGWTLSTSKDVTGYIIYSPVIDGSGQPYDTVFGRESTYYIDTISNPCSQIISYAIASFDSCGNKSEATYEFPRKTILLNEIENNVCAATNMLSWSAYINAIPKLEGYKIFSSEDNGTFTEVGQTDAETLNYIHNNVETGVTYTYYIQAVFGGNSSSSCKKSVTTSTYLKPSFVYLANADVLPSNEVELTVDVDTTVYACTWEIWRSDTNGGNLYQIAAIDRAELKGFPLFYTDTTAEAWGGFYEYQVKVLDSCGRESLESNELKTILLGGSIIDEDHILLSWSAFEGWDAGVNQYLIFRKSGGIEPTLPIDSVDAETLSYTDDISSVGGTSEPISYWVQAIENEGNNQGYKEKSNSNRIGTALESEMYVANAFMPMGPIAEFKPVFRFFSGTDYLFLIYNRWGQLIFESQNPDFGWDGKYKGQYVSLGTYVYTLGYKNLDATSVSKKGTVTVIY